MQRRRALSSTHADSHGVRGRRYPLRHGAGDYYRSPPSHRDRGSATTTVQTGRVSGVTATVTNTTNTTVTCKSMAVAVEHDCGQISPLHLHGTRDRAFARDRDSQGVSGGRAPLWHGAGDIAAVLPPRWRYRLARMASVKPVELRRSLPHSPTRPHAVTCRSTGVVRGNSAVGMISTSGVYTAPSIVPSPATVTVTAVSVADPAHHRLSAGDHHDRAPPPAPSACRSHRPRQVSRRGHAGFHRTVTNSTSDGDLAGQRCPGGNATVA